MIRAALALLICITGYAYSSNGQSTAVAEDSVAVVKTMNRFVDAFSNLGWDEFCEFFADDATAFFPPSSKFALRANNKNEIKNTFSKVFENARKQKQSPPYLDIQPKDLRVQIVGSTAITTFILYDPDLIGRRTLVWVKQNREWKIIHLHASGVSPVK